MLHSIRESKKEISWVSSETLHLQQPMPSGILNKGQVNPVLIRLGNGGCQDGEIWKLELLAAEHGS